MPSFEDKKRILSKRFRTSAGQVRLQKDVTNLFRSRQTPPSNRLDARTFNEVLRVDAFAGTVEVEGMTPYVKLVDATLAHGILPAVVPQLKSITIGGACAGLGIEASSFRYGLAHETMEELEILLADGETVVCTRSNEHSDLFFGFPNSFGTLGYALRVKAKAVKAKKFVDLTHTRCRDHAEFFREIEVCCARPDVDFVDGVVFGPEQHFVNVGRFVDDAPYTSDYTYMSIYYRSIRERARDYLTSLDFIWRWDTDWFWCSRVLHAQNPIVRRLLGRKRLNSVFYKQLIDWPPGVQLRRLWRNTFGIHREAIIQDVDVPVGNAAEFLEFFQREIGLSPIWICPFKAYDPGHGFPLFPTDPQSLYINFGFWDAKRAPTALPEGHFNRLIERKIAALGGIKSLYSDSYFTPDEFWALYDKSAYDKLKAKYDPHGRLSDLYRKCVLRQ